MKALLISIQPQWCELIASGKKTIEVRKTRPKIETPFKCYIYMTATKERCRLWEYITAYQNSKGEILNGSQKVIGGFICDRIEEFHEWQLSPSGKFQEYEQRDLDRFLKESCISFEDVCEYRRNMPYYKPLYGWHISDLKIYDKPKDLGEFWAYNAEIHERFANEEDFCCYNSTNEYGELLNECAIFNTDIKRCYSCWEEWSGWCHRIKRPPQSWCYIEELL